MAIRTNIVESINKKIDAKLQQVALEAQQIMKEEASISHSKYDDAYRSGNLERSIFCEKRGEHEYAVGTNITYAKWVLFGRGPVRPVLKKKLAWQVPGKNFQADGTDIKWVFADYVPPQPPNNFIKRTADRLRSR